MIPSDPTDAEASAKRVKFRGKVKVGPLQKVGYFLRENEWLWAVTFLAVVFAIYANHFRIQPPPDLPLGAVSTKDIRAPFDLQIVDKVATEQKEAEARSKVYPVYDWDSGLAADINNRVASAFEAARTDLAQYHRELKAGRMTRKERQEAEDKLLNSLSDAVGGNLSRFALRQFKMEGFSPALEKDIQGIVLQVEGRKIVPTGDQFQGYDTIHVRDIRKKGSEWDQKNPASSDIITLAEAKRLPGPLVDKLKDIRAQLRGAVEEYVRGLLQPDLTYNSQETKLRKDRAAAQVEPLVVFLKKGQILVKGGEKIDQSALQKIQAYRKASRKVVNMPLLAALFLFLLLLLSFAFMYLKSYRKEHYPDLNLFVLTLQIAAGFLLLSQGMMSLLRIIAEGSKSTLLDQPHLTMFLVPVAAGSLLMTLLVDRHIGVVYTLLFAVLFGILMDFNFGMFLFCMLSCFAGVYAGSKMAQRTAQWKAALFLGVVNVPLAAGVLFADPAWTDYSMKTIVLPMAMAFLAGFPLTVMLVSPFLPLFESIFGVLTEVRLLELSNMNHPLLRQLALEAPGTYNHSLMMANLCEAAANAIGANGLYCRVSCYYHDIGKMLNPLYFVENQTPGQNPHDKLAPRISALIVGAHIKEGIAMARQYKLPQPIIDIIPQHHGTRRISYFLDKALTMVDPEKETINEADFSYPGPRPKSREAAIIMMADGIEAGSRVLKEPTHHRLKSLVTEIVNRVVSEGQLEECDLTFKDLARVQEAFLMVLMGVFSRRISYPGYTFDKEQKNEAPRSEAPQQASNAADS